MGNLRQEERIWIQFLVRPADSGWVKEGEKIIEEFKGKMGASPQASSEKSSSVALGLLSPNEEEIFQGVSRKISKPGFEVLIRYLYIAPKDIFNLDLPKGGLKEYFGQYGSSILNSFSSNPQVATEILWYKWPFFFVETRLKKRKEKIYFRYRTRYIPEETYVGAVSDANIFSPYRFKNSIPILNSEELATLYHPPTNVVLTAPVLERIESKRVSPPSYIPY